MSGEKMEHSPLLKVESVIDDWLRWDMGDDCFWEDWPECPTEQNLTPNMVKSALDHNKAAIAELVAWLTNFAHADLDDAAADAVTVGQVFQKDALRLVAKHKAGE